MWTRRNLVGSVAAGAAGIALGVGRASAQNPSTGDQPQHEGMWKACCETCDSCAKACNKAFHHCMTQVAKGKAEHGRAAQSTADCAEFCTLSATMLARDSSLAMISCAACADACKRCAQDCESFDSDLEMKMCLEECKRCEESCRKMIKA